MKNNNHKVEADSLPNPILSKLNVGLITQRFFLDAYSINSKGRIVFNYSLDNEIIGKEILGLKFQRLCSTNGLWYCGNTYLPTDIFLFYSAIDAIAFAHLFETRYNFDRCLFISLGVHPSKEQILKIISEFAHSKTNFHTGFNKDLLGHITDCKASLWLNGRDCKFSICNEVLSITSNSCNMVKKTVKIDRNIFSYNVFCRQFGKRVNLKIHKPTGENISFLDYLQFNNIP